MSEITNTEMQSWLEAYVGLSGIIKKGIPSGIQKRDGIKECQWVDFWTGQTDTEWESLPFPRPATFIDVAVIDVQDQGDLSQQLTIDFTILTVTESYADTNKDGYLPSNALQFGRYAMLHHKLLHGLNGTHFNDLTRVTGPRQRPSVIGSITVIEQVYRSVIIDYSANPELVEKQVTFEKPELAPAPTPSEPFYTVKTS